MLKGDIPQEIVPGYEPKRPLKPSRGSGSGPGRRFGSRDYNQTDRPQNARSKFGGGNRSKFGSGGRSKFSSGGRPKSSTGAGGRQKRSMNRTFER